MTTNELERRRPGGDVLPGDTVVAGGRRGTVTDVGHGVRVGNLTTAARPLTSRPEDSCLVIYPGGDSGWYFARELEVVG